MDPLASGANTPIGSPMQQQSNGVFLPFDAMRGMPPPLPGMGGSDTPHSNSCRGATPASGAFHGSPVGTPTALPYGEQPQGQIMGFSMPVQAMPNLPPWPLAQQGADGTAPQQAFFVQQPAPT